MLINIYVKESANLNLQFFCRNYFLLDSSFNTAVNEQCIERLKCINQILIIKILRFTISNIFNNTMIWKNMKRIVFEFFVQFNIFIFQNQKNTEMNVEKLKKWIQIDDKTIIFQHRSSCMKFTKIFDWKFNAFNCAQKNDLIIKT